MASVLAQPVLDAPNPPPNGFGGEILVTEFVEPTAGSDEAQNWDFSDMSGVVVNNIELTPASSSLFAPSFPGAQWVVSNGDQLSFLDYTEEGTTVFGNANSANGVVLPFADPLVQWPFPVEYGFTHEDEFGVEQMLFGEPYSLVGNVTSTCDAWGSIVLPNGVGHFRGFARGLQSVLCGELRRRYNPMALASSDLFGPGFSFARFLS